MLLIFLLLFVSTVKSARKVTIDEIYGQKFDFKLFENVDGSSKVYQQEKVLIEKLKGIREKFRLVKTVMKNVDDYDLQNVANCLQNLKMDVEKWQENVQNETSEFPRIEDFDGAIRGLFTIFYTYHFNLTQSMHSGKFEFVDANKQLRTFESYEKLGILDAELLLDMAMNRQIYSAAVQILVHIFEAFQSGTIAKPLLKRLNQKKKLLIKLNNGYLSKSQKILCKFCNVFQNPNSNVGEKPTFFQIKHTSYTLIYLTQI